MKTVQCIECERVLSAVFADNFQIKDATFCCEFCGCAVTVKNLNTSTDVENPTNETQRSNSFHVKVLGQILVEFNKICKLDTEYAIQDNELVMVCKQGIISIARLKDIEYYDLYAEFIVLHFRDSTEDDAHLMTYGVEY